MTQATIPPQVLTQVARALETLTRWNLAIHQARAVEALTRTAGRYEAEYRSGPNGRALWAQVEQAHRTLETFERHALQQGIDPQAVYTTCGGKPPLLLPESAEAQAWRA